MSTENTGSLESDFDSGLTERLESAAEKYDISIPKVKPTSLKKIYNYEQIVDAEEMAAINKAIQEAMVALFRISDNIGKYERLLSKAKTTYKRAWGREYVGATDKTDSARKAAADIATEYLEDDVIVYTQAKEDLKRMAYDMKTLLQSLQTLSSNFRQQMNM